MLFLAILCIGLGILKGVITAERGQSKFKRAIAPKHSDKGALTLDDVDAYNAGVIGDTFGFHRLG